MTLRLVIFCSFAKCLQLCLQVALIMLGCGFISHSATRFLFKFVSFILRWQRSCDGHILRPRNLTSCNDSNLENSVIEESSVDTIEEVFTVMMLKVIEHNILKLEARC